MEDVVEVAAEQGQEMQDHVCTAVVEDLCAATDPEAWDGIE